MAKNQTGIAITIKAFLPTGSTIDEQYNALTIVKDAHASGDYTALLKAAKVEEVKTEQKTRRVEDEPETTTQPPQDKDHVADGAEKFPEPPTDEPAADQPTLIDAGPNDEAVPGFLKKGKGKAA